jgi:hypothetical protein
VRAANCTGAGAALRRHGHPISYTDRLTQRSSRYPFYFSQISDNEHSSESLRTTSYNAGKVDIRIRPLQACPPPITGTSTAGSWDGGSACRHHQENHICRLIPSRWLPSGTSKIYFHMGTADSSVYKVAQEACLYCNIHHASGASLASDSTRLWFSQYSFVKSPVRSNSNWRHPRLFVGITQLTP